MIKAEKKPLYDQVIVAVFQRHHKPGINSFEFTRDEFEAVARDLSVRLPKNLGDVIYSFRHRKALPAAISETAEAGREWIIIGAGIGRYRFIQAAMSRVEPSKHLLSTKVPDATPEIITKYALNDEQALLAVLRYNRLIDIFLGIASYSLQSHLRTTVEGMGQIEIDEVYVGVNKVGAQFIVPVQAKRGSDQLGVVQALQDLTWCEQKYPSLVPRAIAAQFLSDRKIAVFEVALEKYELKVVEEKHYELVSNAELPDRLLREYRARYAP